MAQPFSDPLGEKGWWAWLSHAPEHRVTRVAIEIQDGPRFSRPLRILFASDLHVGSHTDDVRRLTRIMLSAAELQPDVMCLGGDYINGLLFGRGRVPPETTAAIVGMVKPPLGAFAILGDHDELYGSRAITSAFQAAGVTVLLNELATVEFEGHALAIVGVTPDASRLNELLARVRGRCPAMVLAHDPAAFELLPRNIGHLMLCGHTHGGQIQLPFLGPIVNMSDAPLSWTYGHVVEGRSHLYVTSGLGTSLMPVRWHIPPEVVLIEVGFTSAA